MSGHQEFRTKGRVVVIVENPRIIFTLVDPGREGKVTGQGHPTPTRRSRRGPLTLSDDLNSFRWDERPSWPPRPPVPPTHSIPVSQEHKHLLHYVGPEVRHPSSTLPKRSLSKRSWNNDHLVYFRIFCRRETRLWTVGSPCLLKISGNDETQNSLIENN